eukprot:TRINITY_DN33897_c0_g2_i2.p2 TRINITY_DN33897_c0_g2~~TRINITY_DN33897_c0_g2_i2.p2  ORF type:complete len:196 (+),score=-18.92 TRINITY_DN33897_c0_g2_i2:510-1097(+)
MQTKSDILFTIYTIKLEVNQKIVNYFDLYQTLGIRVCRYYQNQNFDYKYRCRKIQFVDRTEISKENSKENRQISVTSQKCRYRYRYLLGFYLQYRFSKYQKYRYLYTPRQQLQPESQYIGVRDLYRDIYGVQTLMIIFPKQQYKSIMQSGDQYQFYYKSDIILKHKIWGYAIENFTEETFYRHNFENCSVQVHIC